MERTGSAANQAWPRGLRVVRAVMLVAFGSSILQAIVVQLDRPLRGGLLVYAGVSIASYGAAALLGVSRERRGLFWVALAIAILHAGFCALEMMRLLTTLSQLRVTVAEVTPGIWSSVAWNLLLLFAAVALAGYLLLVERPRLWPPPER